LKICDGQLWLTWLVRECL